MIISDSLGLPRSQDGINLLYKKTWPYLLFKHVEQNMKLTLSLHTNYGFDSNMLKENIPNYILYEPKYIFIQIGIVDCARRAISKKTLSVLSKIPLINKITKKITSKYHYELTKFFNITYTSKKDFSRNIETFLRNFNSSKIFIIPILPVAEPMKKKSFNIETQINDYNNIIKEISDKYNNVTYLENIFHDLKAEIEQYVYSDGYHLNEFGHNILFNKIKEALPIE